MEEDWDLHAVVRGCSTVTSASTTTTTSSASCVSSSGFGSCHQNPEASCGNSFFGGEKAGQVFSFSYPFEARSSMEELQELCKPFFSKSQCPSSQTSPLSSFSYSSAPKPAKNQIQQKKVQTGSVITPRSKRRKNQLKKVCHVPVEKLSSDIWAWRKYGQKPIKGSPYPRGYYRCSSSKVCLARKQVERNRSDPTMFIVTYTAEHNHPAPTHKNSLAGSTRQKSQSATAGDSERVMAKPTSPATSGPEKEEVPPPSQGATKSESKEENEDLIMEDEEEEEDGFGLLSDMVLTDDFFQSLDELSQLSGAVPLTGGDCFTDLFSSGIALPAWVE